MNFISDYRASTILYNFIVSNDKNRGTWLLPTNICHYVPATILKAGCDIDIVDVSGHDLCINQDQVLSKLDKKHYSGIIYVRAFGVENDADDFFARIRELNENILIVDDWCLGIPSLENIMNDRVDLELFSTGYSKYVDLGYGGYAKIKEELLYEESQLEYSENDEDKFSDYFRGIIFDQDTGDSLRLNQVIQSNWLESRKLDTESYFLKIHEGLNKIKVHKKAINEIYEQNIIDFIKLKESSCNWRYHLLLNNREEVIEELNKHNLFASKHYYSLSKVFGTAETPIWDSLSYKILNLFNDLRYTIKQAEETMNIINKLAK